MSGGTEGVLSPHQTVFTRRPAQGVPVAGSKRLTLGIAFTRDFLPEKSVGVRRSKRPLKPSCAPCRTVASRR